jgi:hypothetical protein
MMRVERVVGLFVLVLLSSASLAQEDEKRLGMEAALGGAYFDNFFQAPDSAEKQNVSGLTGEFELVGRLFKQSSIRGYAGARAVDFNEDLPTASEFNLGLILERERHFLDAGWRRDNNRPTVSVGDEFDLADGDTLTLDYGFRFSRDWQLGAAALVAQEDFSLSPTKESDLWGLGASLRYRGFGSGFSPELGFLTGERDVVNPNEDYDQTDYFVKFRSVPAEPLYLSLRVRFRSRDYSISDPLLSNFERQDDRVQYALTTNYSIGQHLSLNLYATYVDADSTKTSRIFNSSLAFLWMSYRF